MKEWQKSMKNLTELAISLTHLKPFLETKCQEIEMLQNAKADVETIDAIN